MAGSVNKVILVGNLGKDPEIRSLPSGSKVANFSLATSDSWRDKQSGERREKTEWHNVVAFGDGLVRIIEQYVSKGSKVYVEGQLQTRKWQDKEGNDRYSTEVVIQGFGGTLTMLDSRADAGAGAGGGMREGGQASYGAGGGGQFDGPSSGGPSGGGAGGAGGGSGGGFDKQLDDEIPF